MKKNKTILLLFQNSLKITKACTLNFLVISLLFFVQSLKSQCPPGNVILHTQEEVDQFQVDYPNCSNFQGDIQIGCIDCNTDIVDLSSFSQLTSVSGDFFIWYNENLSSLVGLENMINIGGDIILVNNASLASLVGLENLGSIGGTFRLSNASLTSLEGLESLSTIGGTFYITSNPGLNTLTGLGSNVSIGGSLSISDNDNLTNLVGLESVNTLGVSLFIKDNNNLSSLTGLENFTSISGSLQISTNSNLVDLTGLDNLIFVGDDLRIIANNNLISLAALESLMDINGDLVLIGNTNLNDLMGLDNVTFVGHELRIEQSNLSNLDGLTGLTIIGSLYILDNDNLVSIQGLENVTNPLVGGAFISNNENLSICCAILPFLSTASTISIHDNAPGCNSEADIIDSCTPTDPCDALSITTSSSASGSSGSVTITGLDASPVSKVLIFNSNWQTLFDCFGNCNATETITGLHDGDYIVKASLHDQGWSQICEIQQSVSVGAQDCTGLGGDNDGDGTCADDDCDDTNPNIPTTPGTTCDDGDANTNNDVIQPDGCTCAGTPIGGDPCDGLQISSTNTSITVSGLDGAPISKLQIFDADWNIVSHCFGDCQPTETVMGLGEGTYFVRVTLHDVSWQALCDVEQYVTLGGGPTDPCDDLGVEVVDGTVSIQGIANAAITKVHIFDEGWSTVYDCFGVGDCSPPGTLVLADGDYHIRVGTYTAGWQAICEELFDVTVTSGSGSALVIHSQQDIFFFLASKNGRTSRLDWVSNLDYITTSYEVERSADGEQFLPLDVVPSDFSDYDHHNYVIEDASPFPGDNYYRVKMLLQNGTHRYSSIQKLHFEIAFDDFHVYPNPATDRLMVDLGDMLYSASHIAIYNNLGKLVYETIPGIAVSQQIAINIHMLPSGVYTIFVTSPEQARRSKKFVVSRL